MAEGTTDSGASGEAGGTEDVPGEDPAPVTAISTGKAACALSTAGGVRCWGGDPSWFFHGYGAAYDLQPIGDDETPAQLFDIDVGGVVTSLGVGGHNVCVVTQGAGLRCWGLGRYGVPGYGTPEDLGNDEVPAVAGDVPIGGSVQQVTVGEHHACALMADGGVRCWGWNRSGRLGYGTEPPMIACDYCDADPACCVGDDESAGSAGEVDVGGEVVQLSAGVSNTCALIADGSVRCWGNGNGGRIGQGHEDDIGDDDVPADAPPVELGGLAIQVETTEQGACAVLVGGDVVCWGSGVLGYGNTEAVGDDETPADAGPVAVGAPVQRVSGETTVCALLEDGGVRCWGRGVYAQLGLGLGACTYDAPCDELPSHCCIGDDDVPSDYPELDLGGVAIDIAVADRFACALMESGHLRCWGAGGRLGYGDTETIGDDEAAGAGGDVPVF